MEIKMKSGEYDGQPYMHNGKVHKADDGVTAQNIVCYV